MLAFTFGLLYGGFLTEALSWRVKVRCHVGALYFRMFFLVAGSRPLIAAEGDPGVVVHPGQR